MHSNKSGSLDQCRPNVKLVFSNPEYHYLLKKLYYTALNLPYRGAKPGGSIKIGGEQFKKADMKR